MKRLQFGPLWVSYDDSVLEPRPWTMLQAAWAVELGVEMKQTQARMVELCCGAGHIGQAAVTELVGWDLVQIDIDPHACEIARANAATNKLAGCVEVRAADLDTALGPDESFAIVLADPPYLPSSQIGAWPSDPELAIDGGKDGLRLLKGCLDAASRHVAPDGLVLLQVRGAKQARTLVPTASKAGLQLRSVREYDADRAVALFRPGVR